MNYPDFPILCKLPDAEIDYKKCNNWELYAKLTYACLYKKYEILNELLNECYKRGITSYNHPLYAACESGDINIVKLILEKGAKEIDMALYYACKSGNIEIIDILLQKGAKNIDLGFAGAHKAVQKKSMDYMIKLGANSNTTDNSRTKNAYIIKNSHT